MTCPRCRGFMAEDHFYDAEGTAGFMWMKGWRCFNCGHAGDPVMEANRRLRLSTRLIGTSEEAVVSVVSSAPEHEAVVHSEAA